MFFASDNAAPAHPKIIEAIAGANQGFASPYGEDQIMADVSDMIRGIFEAPHAAVFLVATGSAANVLALATYSEPWQTIYCHRQAHIHTDECGAPEFYTGGAGLSLLDGEAAKFSAATLAKAIKSTDHGFVHAVQRGPVTITQATECGTVYEFSEIAAISAVCHEHQLGLHMDGARFANALVSLGCSAAEMTWKAGVDVLSFGGTKNGLVGVEAVILFDPEKAWEFELRRKRGGHLISKHRYLSAQMAAYLTDDLWLDMALAANDAAARLAAGVKNISDASLLYPRQSNAVFARFPRAAHKRVLNAGADYFFCAFDESLDGPPEELLDARLMCSWCTTDPEIEQVLALIWD